MSNELIAITGGIGSGKSMASRVLGAMGFDVYDCDSRAKEIMDRDVAIHHRIATEIDSTCVKEGRIDRRRLSEIVFSDKDKLDILNAIVHGAVREDIIRWRDCHHRHRVIFVETAILYESGLDRMVDAVWEITAPEELRITRVGRRSGLDRDAIRARIAAQAATVVRNPHPDTIQLVNDGVTPLLPQIECNLRREEL